MRFCYFLMDILTIQNFQKLNAPLIVISSNKEYNTDFLKTITKGSKKEFINLRTIQSDTI